MATDWELAIQERVQSNRYIPVAAGVREVVETDHPLEGPSVFWNYERNSNYVVLSRESLEGDNYVDVGRYKVYDATNDRARIRPPEALNDVVASSFETGERIMFLAYESMTTAQNPSIYLLSTAQLLSLLPDSEVSQATAADGGVDLRGAVLRTPGFLPGV